MLPWLRITTHGKYCQLQTEVLPASQHPNQHRSMLQKSAFSQKKAEEDANKDSGFLKLLLHQGGAILELDFLVLGTADKTGE